MIGRGIVPHLFLRQLNKNRLTRFLVFGLATSNGSDHKKGCKANLGAPTLAIQHSYFCCFKHNISFQFLQASFQASARGFLPSNQFAQFYPANEKAKQQVQCDFFINAEYVRWAEHDNLFPSNYEFGWSYLRFPEGKNNPKWESESVQRPPAVQTSLLIRPFDLLTFV